MGTSSSVYELNHEYAWELKVTTMFYRINKTRFVPSFVYRRQSRDSFRIEDNTEHSTCV